MISVHPLEDSRISDTLARFEGADEIPLSIFVTEFPRGDGPPLHVHPYAEIFLVESGAVAFTIEGEATEVAEVAAGNFVIVPADTRHKFEGVSDETNRVVSVHPSAHVVQEDLE
jgi:quercetin dioxygenase-like cupin family protein